MFANYVECNLALIIGWINIYQENIPNKSELTACFAKRIILLYKCARNIWKKCIRNSTIKLRNSDKQQNKILFIMKILLIFVSIIELL